jgi:hypothetical protein|tara:strand:+ start:419 stop:658 length:240 start_codon:yes stop_codon:yes gene_type:complete
MKINTRYQIGDDVYVFLENKLQKIKIKSIYANSFTVYRGDGGTIKTETNYELEGKEGSVEESLLYNSVKEAKENVIVVE